MRPVCQYQVLPVPPVQPIHYISSSQRSPFGLLRRVDHSAYDYVDDPWGYSNNLQPLLQLPRFYSRVPNCYYHHPTGPSTGRGPPCFQLFAVPGIVLRPREPLSQSVPPHPLGLICLHPRESQHPMPCPPVEVLKSSPYFLSESMEVAVQPIPLVLFAHQTLSTLVDIQEPLV